jgi:ABC-type branched-subunit amino acid transport system substrate-binding protein
MATYTITTTDDQETALVYAFEHLVAPPTIPGFPPPPALPATQQEYLQQQVDVLVLTPMGTRYGQAVTTAVQNSLASVPIENQEAALESIKQVITDSGGTVVEPGDPAPPITDPAKQHTLPWDKERGR